MVSRISAGWGEMEDDQGTPGLFFLGAETYHSFYFRMQDIVLLMHILRLLNPCSLSVQRPTASPDTAYAPAASF